jgi:hypothetical protein
MAISGRRSRASGGTELGLQAGSLTHASPQEVAVDQYEALRLVHRHGDEWIPMPLRNLDEVAQHDIDRALAGGAQVYRCASCDEEVAVQIDESRLAEPEPA